MAAFKKSLRTNKTKKPENKSVLLRWRILNFIADSVLIVLLIGAVAYLLDKYMVNFNTYSANYTYSILLIITIYACYYFVFEYFTAQTPGKWITNSMVVDYRGRKPSLKRYVIRTLARVLPIDFLTYMIPNQGFHDKISGTKVIHKR